MLYGTLGFTGSKAILLIIFPHLSTRWIFGSWVIGIFICLLILIIFFRRGVGIPFPKPNLDMNSLQGKKIFALTNHASSIILLAGNQLLPILVANIKGVEVTAYFYIAWMIGNMLFQIPIMISQSSFAEASAQPSKIDEIWRRSLKLSYIISLPSALILIISSRYILNLFGSFYAENSTILLIIICLTTPFTPLIKFF